MRIAIIVIDGVIANNAGHIMQKEISEKQMHWTLQIALETVIEGSGKALRTLEQRGYLILLLTSRSERMRAAMLEWLYTNQVTPLRRLEMKPDGELSAKEWKAQRVGELAREYGASHILIVEDEQTHRDEMLVRNPKLSIAAYTSLDATIAAPF